MALLSLDTAFKVNDFISEFGNLNKRQRTVISKKVEKYSNINLINLYKTGYGHEPTKDQLKKYKVQRKLNNEVTDHSKQLEKFWKT